MTSTLLAGSPFWPRGTQLLTASGVFTISPTEPTSPPACATATAIVSLCTSKPTYLLNLSMTCPLNSDSGPLFLPTSSPIHVA